MRRPYPVLAITPLLLSLALTAGCLLPTDSDDAAPRVPAAPSLSAEAASSAPVSTVTPLEGGAFRFVGTAVLDVPQGAAWAKVHNLEKLTEIALPGMASDFQWLDGGSPGKAPSRYRFVALGATVTEEVYLMDRAEKTLKYRLVTPALGIRSYDGTVSLDPVDSGRTLITFSRDIVFDDPAVVDDFAALFEQEMGFLQAYFAGNAR